MRLVYDRFAKETLSAALGRASVLLTAEREIATDPQGLVLWCEPDRRRLPRLAPFGILGRIVAGGPCAFEFFHEAPSLDEPSLDEMLGSLRKAFVLRAPAMFPARPEEPWLWTIAAGRPTRVLAALGLGPAPGWPAGVHETLPGLRLRLVVTSELPRTLDTLILRVLGAGDTLRDAVRELRTLGAAHPLGRIVTPILVKLHIEARDQPDQDRDPREQEFLMETQDIYEAWHQRVRTEGRIEGLAEGEAHAVLLVLSRRGVSVSSEQAARIRACRDVRQLELWLDRALTATSMDEVLR